MNLSDLKLFLEVTDQLSFASVADRHGVSVSSISRPIARLEAHLGARLFERTTRRMSLTEAGTLFLKRARLIVDEMEAAQQSIGDLVEEPSGHLRMTSSVAFGECVLSPLIADFRRTAPGISLELVLTDSNLDLISEGIDLAVRLAARPSDDLIATRLMTTRYHVVASPAYLHAQGHPVAPTELSKHTCLRLNFEPWKSTWKFRSPQSTETKVSVSGPFFSSSPLALKSAALGGSGIALLADWLVAEDLKAGRLTNLFADYACAGTDFDTAAWLLFPSRSYMPVKTRTMIDFLKQRLSR